MNSRTWAALSGFTLVAMAGATQTSLLLGGCDGMIECTSGFVPMKCHWTFVATALVSLIGVVSSIAGMFLAKSKDARRIAALVTLATSIVIALIPTSFVIGLCNGDGMTCHQTAIIVWVDMAAVAIASLVQLAKADIASSKKPKMKL